MVITVNAINSKTRKNAVTRPDVLHTYLKAKEVNQYMEYISNRYSTFVKLQTIGRSYEGRPLKAVDINWCCEDNVKAGNVQLPQVRKQTSNDPANYILIEGGSHAREWISISVALNCIYQLTEKHARHQDLLRNLRFLIVPLTNPDGYEYSRTKNKRWRKNRRLHNGSKHIGTDCNRNWDFHWELGNSKIHRNTYKGSKPFSEPETCAIRNVMQKLGSRLLFVLSLHSYATSIMYPWGYSKDLPESWQLLDILAKTGCDAIKAYNGRVYRYGSISNVCKRTITGSIVDYAFGVMKVPFALVMELPSKEFGFQPPVEAISPLSHESWYGIREMCKRVYDLARANDKFPTPNNKSCRDVKDPLEEALLKVEMLTANAVVSKDETEQTEKPMAKPVIKSETLPTNT